MQPPSATVRFFAVFFLILLVAQGILIIISGGLPEDQYLCTGLDLYVFREPDLFSCMALVHSRIRQVVFVEADPSFGALESSYRLHTCERINHRFRVFAVRCTDSEKKPQ